MRTSLASSTSAAAVGADVSSRPVLRGVVFDMDGTLTVPNLDFAAMYRRCGVDPQLDILAELATRPPAQAQAAYAVIEEMEQQGRDTLQLMPGARELAVWLAAHQIPTALVTRNTRRTVDVLDRLLQTAAPTLTLDVVISRDDERYPPKPDPAALYAIAERWQTSPTNLVMVGDSPANDIGFGRAANAVTALLDTGRRYHEQQTSESHATPSASSTATVPTPTIQPDIVTDRLGSLPGYLWRHFTIEGALGTNAPNLHGTPAPLPTHPLHAAAARGDWSALATELQRDDLAVNQPDEHGNTALIWAAEHGHVHLVERLVAHPGVDVNIRGYLGATAICRAARRGNTNVLQRLLQAGADPDIGNDKLQYPLHFAAFKQHPACVRVLVDHGANLDVLDRKGRVPAEDTACATIQEILRTAMAM